jgi:hypothetical protein
MAGFLCGIADNRFLAVEKPEMSNAKHSGNRKGGHGYSYCCE